MRDAYHEEVRLTFRQTLLLAVVGVVAACVAAFSYRMLTPVQASGFYGTALSEPQALAPFTLTDADGKRVTLEAWRGEYLLVFFGYTRCPDTCPLTLGRLAKVYDDLGRPENVQVVMVSFDPQHDTPELTQRYVGGFDPSFVGLSGSVSDVAKAARKFYVGYRRIDRKDFVHTDSVALIDPEGRMRLVYMQDKIARLTDDLTTVLAERPF